MSAKVVNKVRKKSLFANDFLILCIKKPIYASLVQDNINSLHIYNPRHRFTIITDSACLPSLEKLTFDYPKQVKFLNNYSDDPRPWQFIKIDTAFLAAEMNTILVDADTLWWSDPVVPAEGVVFQVKNKRFFDWHDEKISLSHIFGDQVQKEAFHYVTGFLRIPSTYVTPKLKEAVISLATKLWSFPQDTKIPLQNPTGLQRLCEEIALGYTLQTFIPPESITTLKENDPYNDKNTMQSLYYGAINGV